MGIGLFTSKTFLLLLSLVFLAAAAGLGYVGISVIVTYKQYENFLGNFYVMVPAAIILGMALVMLFIGIQGCCATAQESCCGLGCFMFQISIIFAAGVVALILGLVYKDKINPELEKNMKVLFDNYDGKNVQSSAVDFMQEQLSCCGRKNYTDWTETKWFATNKSLPLSCCKKSSPECKGSLIPAGDLNTEGCELKLESLIHQVLRYSMFVILGFAIVELFAIISMCVITCRNDRNGYQVL
ncbi:tetraspanin-36-like [Rhinophrynus dorsalis]